MRFRIHLALVNPTQNMMPLNYQYELSNWIFKTIHYGDKQFITWLQKNGYLADNKKFKFFTFSGINIPQYKLLDDRLFVNSEKVSFLLTFQVDSTIENYVIGLFRNQRFSIGDKKSAVTYQVKYVEKLTDPEFRNEMNFKTLTPVLISKPSEDPENEKPVYLLPESLEYQKLFFGQLNRKYIATLGAQKTKTDKPLFSHSGETKLELLSIPKSRLVKIKADTPEEHMLKGYIYEFKIKAPVHLIKIGYQSGFGELNNLGFGCVNTKV